MDAKPLNFVELLNACRTHDFEWLRLAYGLQPDDLEALNGAVDGPTAVARGQLLCPEGRGCEALFAVQNGAFKSYLTDHDGDAQITGFHFAGELIGLDALYDGRHHSTVAALEPSYVFRMNTDKLEAITGAVPGLQRELLRLIGRRIREDEQHVLLIGQKSAPERLATYFLYLHRRQDNGGDPQVLYLPMSRDDLANFLGLAAETLSRLLARFSGDGLIAIPDRKHLELCDLARLGEVAGFQPS